MLVLLWATLLCAGRSNNANAIAPPVEEKHCENGICINLEITAEAGLCVVLPCCYDIDHFVLESADWYKCDLSKPSCTDSDVILHWNNTNPNAQSGSREWLSMLDLTQHNCGFIINDLSKSDTGSYQVRLHGILNGSRKGFTSARRTTITVEDLIQKPTVMIPPLTEGQQATLTCTAPGLCSGSEPDITWTWRGAGEKASHITENIAKNIPGFKYLTAATQRHSSTLMFNPSAEHHGTEVTCKVTFTNNITTEETVTLNVTYLKHVQSSVKANVEEDEALNLTCSVGSFPPSLITWNKNLNNDTGTATLIIPNAAVGYSGQYICTAKHLDKTLTVMNVKKHEMGDPKILNSSGCIKQSEVLTCVCISEGFPLPTIKWPLLENHAEYSVITTVSTHTVNSTAILTVTNSNTSVECVSSNENGKAKENLTVNEVEEEEDGLHMKLLRIVTRLEIIVTFLIGVLLSAIICCFVRKCHRKKQRIYGNLAETLEMVTSHEDPLTDAGQAVEDYQTIDQVAAEAGGAAAAGKSDVPEYSKINFSLIKRRSPAEAGMTPETTETEYAEIKELKKIEEEADERQDGEDEEEMIGEDEETKPEEKEGEDVALYSSVKDVMS